MEENWNRYGAPLCMVLAAVVAAFSFERLYYGVDFLSESRNTLFQLHLVEGYLPFQRELSLEQIVQILIFPLTKLRSFLTDETGSVGLVFYLRKTEFLLSMGAAILLAVSFRSLVPVAVMTLFAAPLVAFTPGGVLGASPLALGMIFSAAVLIVGWRWYNEATIAKAWILPWAALLLFLALPETTPMILIGLLLLLFRKTKDSESSFVKLHLLASVNIVVILTFAAFRHTHLEGLVEAWRLQQDVLGLPWTHWNFIDLLRGLFPSMHVFLIFMAGILLALLLPSRFFHPFFAVVCVSFAALSWSSQTNPGEMLILYLAPLVLLHFWKIRKALPPTFNLRFVVISCLLLFFSLAFTRGLLGSAIAVLPLFIFLFATGWIRGLRTPVVVSAFVFSSTLVVAQYLTFPEGQRRMESIDRIDHGPFEGLWVPRKTALEILEIESDIAKAPVGPASMAVIGDRPGIYLLSPLEPVAFLYSLPPAPLLRAEMFDYFSGVENSPDLVFELKTAEAGQSEADVFTNFFKSDLYRVLSERPDHTVYIKTEFIEKAMKDPNFEKNEL